MSSFATEQGAATIEEIIVYLDAFCGQVIAELGAKGVDPRAVKSEAFGSGPIARWSEVDTEPDREAVAALLTYINWKTGILLTPISRDREAGMERDSVNNETGHAAMRDMVQRALGAGWAGEFNTASIGGAEAKWATWGISATGAITAVNAGAFKTEEFGTKGRGRTALAELLGLAATRPTFVLNSVAYGYTEVANMTALDESKFAQPKDKPGKPDNNTRNAVALLRAIAAAAIAAECDNLFVAPRSMYPRAVMPLGMLDAVPAEVIVKCDAGSLTWKFVTPGGDVDIPVNSQLIVDGVSAHKEAFIAMVAETVPSESA